MGEIGANEAARLIDLPVNDDEARDVGLGVEVFVDTGHDESNDALEGDTKNQAVLGTEPVTYRCANG